VRYRADLDRLSTGAALAMVVLAAAQVAVEVVGVGVLGIPVPTSVRGWFELLASNRLLGLTELTALQIPLFGLLPILLLGLRAVLWRIAPAVVDVATVLGLIGVAVYLSGNTSLAMISLAERYAAASGEADRAALIAAGESMLGVYGGPALNAGVPLMMISSLVFAVLMRRSDHFGRGVAAAGMVATLVSLAYYLPLALGESRILILEAGAALFVFWIGWTGWRFRSVANSPVG
jgi:hypothetical protein